MITTLTNLLTGVGCTKIIYERGALKNIAADEATQADIIGLINEPNTVNLVPVGSGVKVKHAPIIVEILEQVEPERKAQDNKALFEALLTIAQNFVWDAIQSESFEKIGIVTAIKVEENQYDANVIGWSLSLNWTLVVNKTNC